jgi:hypothetical protein
MTCLCNWVQDCFGGAPTVKTERRCVSSRSVLVARAVRAALVVAVIGRAAVGVSQVPPATPDDIVVWAKESLSDTSLSTLTLGRDTRLTSGQVVVNDPGGVLLLRSYFRGLAGTQLIADTVVVPPSPFGKPEVFDLFANSFDPGRGVIITDQGPTPISLPLFTFPSAVAVTPGTDSCPTPGRTAGDCVVRSRNGPVTLQPGNYNIIRVRSDGVLSFAGGTYNMRSIRTARNSKLLFNAPATLNVAEIARFGFRAFVGAEFPDQLSARCMVINVAGDKVQFQPWADVTATVTAPAADMQMGHFGVYQGNFTAKTVRVRLGATLEAPVISTCQ